MPASLLALACLMSSPISIPALVEEYRADLGSLTRLYSIEVSPQRRMRLKSFVSDWRRRLEGVDVDRLDFDGKIDHLLFRNLLDRQERRIDLDEKRDAPTLPLLPFQEPIVGLVESRRRFELSDPEKAAGELSRIAEAARKARLAAEKGEVNASKPVANRAARVTRDLAKALSDWYGFYNEYDPLFGWWCEKPYAQADEELKAFAAALRKHLVGVDPDDDQAIVGLPVGREALEADLAHEMVPYAIEELIEIAKREYAWCEARMKEASRDLGLGDDWKKALETVKDKHVEPGRQPALVHELAVEAIDFLEEHELVTIPPLCKETWRMEMMSAKAQKSAPFFLGGEAIIVSYPTRGMTHDEKLMSMRGNNRHFARATVQHELVPGHHLQQFMNRRNRPYRQVFGTPFWVEGWALHWEMLLWDLGFAQTPEDRIGMLFWRMHRCARIEFSLGFHLGTMTPEECIRFLVDKVGHEPASAEGEVRRSLSGDYPPLYQLAYMIGGLQFRALHKDLVGSGKMSNREFHDAILRENEMPVEVLRKVLTRAVD